MIPLPGSAPPSRGDSVDPTAGPTADPSVDPCDGTTELGVSFSSPRGGLTVLTVSGEVDTLTAPRLGIALDELLDRPGDDAGRDVAVDLEGVTFLASSGLGVLIHTARRAARDDRRLFVVATNRAVLRPLEVTGSAQLFTVLHDRDGIPGP
ncbi:hypothetical protein AFB00_18290 [Pseudonocardia sp. HH130630-07]|nr:hypothetical protein AFB00_18290 [Pseudonocardia sp. HH130630-07]